MGCVWWGPCLREGVQKQDGLTPCGIDLIPLHSHGVGAAQAKARDGRKGAIVPDVECVVDHVGAPQPVQVHGRPVDLCHADPHTLTQPSCTLPDSADLSQATMWLSTTTEAVQAHMQKCSPLGAVATVRVPDCHTHTGAPICRSDQGAVQRLLNLGELHYIGAQSVSMVKICMSWWNSQ